MKGGSSKRRSWKQQHGGTGGGQGFQQKLKSDEQGDDWSRFEVQVRGKMAKVRFRGRVRERIFVHISSRHIKELVRSYA